MKKVIRFLLFLGLTFGPASSISKGWLEKTAGKIFGAPAELMTNSSLENMQQKLDGNIDHLDKVMGDNISKLTTQANEVLKMREDQLDTILRGTAADFNNGLSKNIQDLNLGIDASLASFRYEENVFDETLYTTTRNLAGLALLVIFVNYAVLSYSKMNFNSSLKKNLIDYFKRLSGYLLFTLCGFLFIYYFESFSKPYVNEKFEDQKRRIASDAKIAFKVWAFEEMAVKTSILVKLDPNNIDYQYANNKALVMKELFLNSDKEIRIGEKARTSFRIYSEFYEKNNIKDPEYFVIYGYFNKKILNSKLGDFIAALGGVRYMKSPAIDTSKIYTIGEMEPMALKYLDTYNMNPYNQIQLDEACNGFKVSLNLYENNILSGHQNLYNQLRDSLTSIKRNEIILDFDLHRNNAINIQRDQYYHYLENNRIADNSFVSSIKSLSDKVYQQSAGRYLSEKSIEFDDSFIYALSVLDSNTKKQANSIRLNRQDMEELAAVAGNQAYSNIRFIFPITQKFLLRILKATNGELVKAAKINLVRSNLSTKYGLAVALIQQQQYLRKDPDNFTIDHYKFLIRAASELNIYVVKNKQLNIREPLAYLYLNAAINRFGLVGNAELFREYREYSDNLLNINRYTD